MGNTFILFRCSCNESFSGAVWLFGELLTFYVAMSAASSLSDQVSQAPEHIVKFSGETAMINCSHSIPAFDCILWYKQTRHGQLQFLGYTYTNMQNPEPGLDLKLSGNAETNQVCTLTIEFVNTKSSAVYFCAARTTMLHLTTLQ